MSELNDLRDEVARLRRAATRKISRIKQTHGAQVSGTEFDPRRETKAPTKYTAKQLAAYKSTLANFVSRSTQFVPDASKQPIPRAEFERYKAREARYRETAGSVFERVKNDKLPSGETVAERVEKMRPLHKAMHNTAVNSMFDPVTRDSESIVSRKALDKLSRSIDTAASPAAIRRKILDARRQLAQMMDTLNMPEVHDLTKKLTNDQFVALWNYTNFATAISLNYENAKKMLSPKEESWGHEQIRQQMGDALEMITWASQRQV